MLPSLSFPLSLWSDTLFVLLGLLAITVTEFDTNPALTDNWSRVYVAVNVIIPLIEIVLLVEPDDTLETTGSPSRLMLLPFPSVIVSVSSNPVREVAPVFSTLIE